MHMHDWECLCMRTAGHQRYIVLVRLCLSLLLLARLLNDACTRACLRKTPPRTCGYVQCFACCIHMKRYRIVRMHAPASNDDTTAHTSVCAQFVHFAKTLICGLAAAGRCISHTPEGGCLNSHNPDPRRGVHRVQTRLACNRFSWI